MDTIVTRKTYSVREAAAVLGVSVDTIYSSVARGDIPHLRLQKRIVIPIKALERLLSNPSERGAA